MARRVKCAGRGCEHSRSSHDEQGRCLVCPTRDGSSERTGFCRGWATTRAHWWRDYTTDAFRSADHAWWLDREMVAVGYVTEMSEYADQHPRPRFRDFLIHLANSRDDA